MRALARDPDDRFQTARDMSAAIGRALFQRQEFVDAAAVEATIAQLVGRDETSPGISDPPPSAVDPSVALSALAQAAEALAPRPSARLSEPADSMSDERKERRNTGRAAREVRHVAVIMLRLWGFDQLEGAIGLAGASRAADKIRGTLDDIAYKRGLAGAGSRISAPVQSSD